MPIPEDIAHIARQEKELLLPSFTPEDAWRLGSDLRELAVSRAYSIVIDIRRFGQPIQPLFYTALPGTTPDNPRWVERKTRVVSRFHRSSYMVGLELAQRGLSFGQRYNLPEEDYAAHGGCFPLHVIGAGVIGSLTISGLVQRADHELAVEALCLYLGRNYHELKLPEESK